MVRFSSNAIMLRSLLQYRGELTAAAATSEYNLAAVRQQSVLRTASSELHPLNLFMRYCKLLS
jgi:hypothetical protein